MSVGAAWDTWAETQAFSVCYTVVLWTLCTKFSLLTETFWFSYRKQRLLLCSHTSPQLIKITSVSTAEGVVALACNSRTQEAEARGSPQVGGQHDPPSSSKSVFVRTVLCNTVWFSRLPFKGWEKKKASDSLELEFVSCPVRAGNRTQVLCQSSKCS